MKNLLKFGAVGIAAGLLSFSASANTISLINVTATPAGGGSDWTYSYSFANSALLTGSSFFTINDFGPAVVVVPPVFPAPLWSFSQAGVGANSVPIGSLFHGDNPGILNVTFTWTGATGPVGNAGPFIFTLHSPGPVTAAGLVSYSTLDQQVLDPTLSSKGLGELLAPVPDAGMSIALLGFALTGLGLARRKLA